MKKFAILTFLLSLIFAPFVFAVDIFESMSEMPGYNIKIVDPTVSPMIDVHCRDVFTQTSNHLYLKNSQIKPYIYETDGRNLEMIPETYKNHKGAAVLTDKTTSLIRQDMQRQYINAMYHVSAIALGFRIS